MSPQKQGHDPDQAGQQIKNLHNVLAEDEKVLFYLSKAFSSLCFPFFISLLHLIFSFHCSRQRFLAPHSFIHSFIHCHSPVHISIAQEHLTPNNIPKPHSLHTTHTQHDAYHIHHGKPNGPDHPVISQQPKAGQHQEHRLHLLHLQGPLLPQHHIPCPWRQPNLP